ncbi:MAG: hypothetical protein WD426_09140 [Anditalea sp.]
MDFLTKHEISSSLERTRKLLDSGILWDPTLPPPFYRQSVFIEVLINLKDLLVKSQKLLNQRVDFTDDVIKDEQLKITDVTDLIANFRDAACHNDSFRRKFGSFVSSFNEKRGKVPLGNIGNVRIENKFQDEIAFNMGKNILYLKRHLERAFYEVEKNFKPHLSP